MAGLTLTFPILLFLQAFGMLVGAGAATRISIYLGRKDNRMAEKVLGNAFTLTFLITALTVAPCMIWMNDLLQAFGGSEQTIPYAKDYLEIVVPGTLLTSLSFGFNAVMRASGYPKKAMYTMLIGAIANVILDPIFIFWFDMGIRGAAIATVISMLLGTLFVMYHFVQKKSIVRFRRGTFGLERNVVWNILTIGISPFAMQLTGSLVVVIQNAALKQYGGDLALGANGIITSVTMLIVMLIIGIAQGMQPIVGFNYGAGQFRRVQETLRPGHHHLDGYHGYWMCGKRRFPGMDCKCFHTRRGFTGCDRQWSTNHIARIHCGRFTNFDQPILPKHWYCMESDIPQFESSIAVSGACDITLFPRVGARWGLVCRTILRLRRQQ